MVICTKCFFKLKRESNGECTYKGNKEHAWMDYDIFRDKIIPVIREHITELQENDKRYQIKFNKSLESYNKQLDEINKKYNTYLNNELPREVEKKKLGLLNEQWENEAYKKRDINKEKQKAERTLLLEGIGFAVGIFIIFIWIIPAFDLGTVFNYFLFIIGLFVVFTFTSLRSFLKSKSYIKSRLQELYAESQSFPEKLSAKLGEYTDKLKKERYDNSGFYKIESDIEAEKREFEHISRDIRQRIEIVERALNGNDDELVNFLKEENKTKNWYIETFHKGVW